MRARTYPSENLIQGLQICFNSSAKCDLLARALWNIVEKDSVALTLIR